LVDQLVGRVRGGGRIALAVFDDGYDLLAEDAALGVPFLDGEQGAFFD
jgi:hypothetical protein